MTQSKNKAKQGAVRTYIKEAKGKAVFVLN